TMQLVSADKVVVYTLKRGLTDTVLSNEKAVCDRFGFVPPLLVDFKGLRGDPSDNIIGIKGIGEKTATALIQEFGSIENIYQELAKGKSGEGKFIKAGIKPRIIELLKEGEEEALFSKTLATIRRDAPIDFNLPTNTWRESFDFSGIEKTFGELDFKTLTARAKTVLLGRSTNQDTITTKQEDVDPVLLQTSAIALWLLLSDKTNPKVEDIYAYTEKTNLKDASAVLLKEIKEKDLTKVFENIELPLIPILKQAEQRGILIDPKCFKKLSKDFHKDLVLLEQKIYTMAGHEFNISSPKQLGVVLFDELGLTAKGLKKTAGGARSTRESELLKLAESAPIVADILKFRELSKLVSTYIDAIPRLADSHNRLHGHLHQTGTTTGRMSSSDPNLQNIPASQIYGTEIRKGFIATPGHVLVVADYSQIELRVLAMLSGDPTLKNIFKTGQ
ncbi:MAG: DNA polymerase, partial [Patescibacteria group bacterium]